MIGTHIDIILIVTGALTFDLLHQDGVDLRSLALSDRKRDFPGQRAFLDWVKNGCEAL